GRRPPRPSAGRPRLHHAACAAGRADDHPHHRKQTAQQPRSRLPGRGVRPADHRRNQRPRRHGRAHPAADRRRRAPPLRPPRPRRAPPPRPGRGTPAHTPPPHPPQTPPPHPAHLAPRKQPASRPGPPHPRRPPPGTTRGHRTLTPAHPVRQLNPPHVQGDHVVGLSAAVVAFRHGGR